ncbi:hypothetical protein REPUB_Repub18cG0073300 [Reevesia pubescens]
MHKNPVCLYGLAGGSYWGKCFDRDQIIHCIKFKFEAWENAKWPNFKECRLNDLRSSMMVAFSVKEKVTNLAAWIAPPAGTLKFNMDGASASFSGKVGICGIPRNNERAILLIFSKAIRLTDSYLVELLAVK